MYMGEHSRTSAPAGTQDVLPLELETRKRDIVPAHDCYYWVNTLNVEELCSLSVKYE